MEKKATTIFHLSGVSYFPVPHALLGDKYRPRLIGQMSAASLRLYLYVVAKAGRGQRPIVAVSNSELEKAGIVGPNHVLAARAQLELLQLVKVTKKKSQFMYEVLNPISKKSLPSVEEFIPIENLSETQLEQVFSTFLSNQLVSNENGLLYRCPFHVPLGHSRSKTKPLSVQAPGPGLWQCLDATCRHHGNRQRSTIKDMWNDPTGIWSLKGGGNVVDFIRAITFHNEEIWMSEHEATTILRGILTPKSVGASAKEAASCLP